MNLLLSVNADTDKECTDAGHIYLGAAPSELPCEVHVFLKKGGSLPDGELSPEQAGEILRWLRASTNMSGMEDPAFLKKYVEAMEDAYRSQAHTLNHYRQTNDQLLTANEEHYARLNWEIDRLHKKLQQAGVSVDRFHEECFDCKLKNVEPPECTGHVAGPSPCHRFQGYGI